LSTSRTWEERLGSCRTRLPSIKNFRFPDGVSGSVRASQKGNEKTPPDSVLKNNQG
jgi:hypothetical protein